MGPAGSTWQAPVTGGRAKRAGSRQEATRRLGQTPNSRQARARRQAGRHSRALRRLHHLPAEPVETAQKPIMTLPKEAIRGAQRGSAAPLQQFTKQQERKRRDAESEVAELPPVRAERRRRRIAAGARKSQEERQDRQRAARRRGSRSRVGRHGKRPRPSPTESSTRVVTSLEPDDERGRVSVRRRGGRPIRPSRGAPRPAEGTCRRPAAVHHSRISRRPQGSRRSPSPPVDEHGRPLPRISTSNWTRKSPR